MVTIRHALDWGQSQLSSTTSAALDARLLLQHTLGWSSERIIGHGDEVLSSQQNKAYQDLVHRRVKGEPVSKIMGTREFWGRAFQISPDVLDPRPDSEILIERVLEAFPDKTTPFSILDVGIGSGCLLLTLLAEYPNAVGVGVDLSSEALKISEQNAARLGVKDRLSLLESDLFAKMNTSINLFPRASTSSAPRVLSKLPRERRQILESFRLRSFELQRDKHGALSPLQFSGCGFLVSAAREEVNRGIQVSGQFEILISNPPYIPTAVIETLDKEVKDHDPHLALDGGETGLDYYHRILSKAKNYLKSPGHIVLEIGYDQAEAIREIARGYGFNSVNVYQDLGKRDRCVVIDNS